MLSSSAVIATLATADMARSRAFYEGKLGLPVAMEVEEGVVVYACGGGTHLFIYARPDHIAPANTVATWQIENIDATVDELTAKGVKFEQYTDLPGGEQTDERGITTIGENVRAAWFADPDGNIHNISEGSM